VAEFDYPQANGFYFFKKDSKTGLNAEVAADRTQKAKAVPIFWLSLASHMAIFNPNSILFKILCPIARSIDKTNAIKKVCSYTEHAIKTALYNCMQCGDCSLFDVAYLCPTSQCPKRQTNALCGGSFEGWCEVYPNEKKCIWVKAYERLRATHNEDEIGDYIVPPQDWDLWETSSWLNFYNGRDHSAKRLGVKPPEKKRATDNSPEAK
jgi:methylenetetrahydrofolate reductase (NADPH)